MINSIKIYRKRACKCKKKYSFIGATIKMLQLRLTGEKISSYKCLFGNHFHVGHVGLRTLRKYRNIARRLAKNAN